MGSREGVGGLARANFEILHGSRRLSSNANGQLSRELVSLIRTIESSLVCAERATFASLKTRTIKILLFATRKSWYEVFTSLTATELCQAISPLLTFQL